MSTIRMPTDDEARHMLTKQLGREPTPEEWYWFKRAIKIEYGLKSGTGKNRVVVEVNDEIKSAIERLRTQPPYFPWAPHIREYLISEIVRMDIQVMKDKGYGPKKEGVKP